jgi:hypothetical protein
VEDNIQISEAVVLSHGSRSVWGDTASGTDVKSHHVLKKKKLDKNVEKKSGKYLIPARW